MRNILRSTFGFLAIFVAVNVIYVPGAFAQFGIKLPKLPNVGKDSKDSKDSKDAKNSSADTSNAAPAPPMPPLELSSLTPNLVPAGWKGDVVFTGKNFLQNWDSRRGISG